MTDKLEFTPGVRDVLVERARQVAREGFTTEHDDEHSKGELAIAGYCYARHAVAGRDGVPRDWPWEDSWWKPRGPRRDLVRAAALLIAEIERRDRAFATEIEKPSPHAGPCAPLAEKEL